MIVSDGDRRAELARRLTSPCAHGLIRTIRAVSSGEQGLCAMDNGLVGTGSVRY